MCFLLVSIYCSPSPSTLPAPSPPPSHTHLLSCCDKDRQFPRFLHHWVWMSLSAVVRGDRFHWDVLKTQCAALFLDSNLWPPSGRSSLCLDDSKGHCRNLLFFSGFRITLRFLKRIQNKCNVDFAYLLVIHLKRVRFFKLVSVKICCQINQSLVLFPIKAQSHLKYFKFLSLFQRIKVIARLSGICSRSSHFLALKNCSQLPNNWSERMEISSTLFPLTPGYAELLGRSD